MKIFNLILAALFFLFAIVQLNDQPGDILFWFSIYAFVGVISAFGAFNRYNMWVIVLGIGAAVYQLFRMFPAFSLWLNSGMPSIIGEMHPSSPHIELVREFLGLVVCLIVLVYHYVRYSRLRKKREV